MGKWVKKGSKMIVTCVTIILIIIMGITIGGRAKVSAPENLVQTIITPIQRALYTTSQSLQDFGTSLFAFKRIAKENEVLKKENQKLKRQNIQLSLTKNELEELRELSKTLNYVKQIQNQKYITASVTGMNMGNWFNIFTINVGQDQGVVKDSTVINEEGLIGKVYEVGRNWAKVITIIDNKSSVSFEVLRNHQYIGVVQGKKSQLSGYLIDPQAEVLVGDKLITSGLSMYEKGIMIGTVKEVHKKEDELLKNITVEPTVNFTKIDKVLILLPQD